MLLGLIIALREKGKEPQWLNFVAVAATVVGITVSVYDIGMMHELTQWLELGLAIGFLAGTFLLAREIASGYIFFMIMNASNAGLMYLEHYPWLVLQQIFSFGVMFYAYKLSKSRQK